MEHIYIYIYICILNNTPSHAAHLKLGLHFLFLPLLNISPVDWSCLHPGTEWPKDSYGLEASPNDWRPRPTGVLSGGWRGLLEGSFHDLDTWLITMVRFRPPSVGLWDPFQIAMKMAI